jgi:2-oxoisovalerate dehydrogenase E1 component beta subunit
MTTRTLIESIRDALFEEMRRDESVILMGEDVGRAGGVFRTTEGLFAEFGEARVIDTPLAECGIVGVAIGAALNGMRPVAEIQFADFIHPAMNQIMNEAAKIRFRSNGEWGCPLVIRAPYGAGVHGGMYHSQSVEALFHHVPGLKIVAPSTPYDAKGLLKSAIRDEDPVLFFEHKKAYRRVKGDIPDKDYVVPIGKAEIKRPGTDLTIITYGYMVHVALEAAEQLEVQGISTEVLDLRSLLPLDHAAICESVGRTNKVIVFHEDTKTGGVGAEVSAILAEDMFESLDGPIVRVAAPDTPPPYSPPLEEAFVPNARVLIEAANRLAAY